MNVRQENQASKFILSKTSFCGNTAIILGSGLGEFARVLNDRIHLEYSKIPYYFSNSQPFVKIYNRSS